LKTTVVHEADIKGKYIKC